MNDYTRYVNILQGTASEPRFSTGNTLLHVCAPFGMNIFCLHTKGSAKGWFYHPSHKHCEGVRVHLGGGKTLDIENGNSKDNIITREQIMSGETLYI